MENNDDILLMQFFDEHKQQIADKGFSQRVMQRIPRHQSALPYIIWQIVCVGLGILMFFAFDGVSSLRVAWQNFIANAISYIISIDLSAVSPLLVLGSISVGLYSLLWVLKEKLGA